MFTPIKKVTKTLLNLGFEEEYGNDLNQKHVVNFSYLLFCATNVLMLVLFVPREVHSLVTLSALGLVIALIGLKYNQTGRFTQAQLIMPLVKIGQIGLFSLMYFGTASHFHWLLLNVLAYTFVVFRADQRVAKYWILITCALLFLICEFTNTKGVYLTVQDQRVVILSVFFAIAFYFTVVIHLVMNRLKSVNQHLRVLAEKDELTGLANRRKVLADAVNIFADSVINRDQCVFAIVDLDHFKKINDTFGHEAGDLVLFEVSTLMASVIRSQDKIGRYGGEEFIVIMPNTTLRKAEYVMEHLRQSVEAMEIKTDKGIIVPVTISIGVASITPKTSRYEEILAQADKGLYEAKHSGRNRISIQSAR